MSEIEDVVSPPPPPPITNTFSKTAIIWGEVSYFNAEK